MVKLGYRAEPRLLVGSFAMALFAAVPDALVALWIALLADGAHQRRAHQGAGRGRGTGRLGRGHLVHAGAVRPRTAPLPRQGQRGPRIARRPPPGLGRDDRAPRAARVPRPAERAPRPGVRARPHVPVPVRDGRLVPPPRLHRRDPRVGPRLAGLDRAAGGADPLHRHVAAGCGTGRRGGGGPPRPAGPPRLHPGHHRTGRQGGAPGRHRCPSDRGPGRRVGPSGTRRWAPSGGGPPPGTRPPGRSSGSATSAASCSWPRGSTLRRRRCCSWWWPADACRSTSPRRSASSGSCAASGSTRLAASPGSRTTQRPSTRTPTSSRPTGSPTASASSEFRSATPARIGSCSRTSTCTFRPARWSRSSARTAPARPRS